jgi:hypothetical protein
MSMGTISLLYKVYMHIVRGALELFQVTEPEEYKIQYFYWVSSGEDAVFLK